MVAAVALVEHGGARRAEDGTHVPAAVGELVRVVTIALVRAPPAAQHVLARLALRAARVRARLLHRDHLDVHVRVAARRVARIVRVVVMRAELHRVEPGGGRRAAHRLVVALAEVREGVGL